MHTTKSLKKIISYFHAKKSFKKYILACILALITNLLKPWELDQYFKKLKKVFCFVLISGIMNFYVKRIPGIKNIVFFIDIRTIRFLLDKIMIFLPRRTFLKPQTNS